MPRLVLVSGTNATGKGTRLAHLYHFTAETMFSEKHSVIAHPRANPDKKSKPGYFTVFEEANEMYVGRISKLNGKFQSLDGYMSYNYDYFFSYAKKHGLDIIADINLTFCGKHIKAACEKWGYDLQLITYEHTDFQMACDRMNERLVDRNMDPKWTPELFLSRGPGKCQKKLQKIRNGYFGDTLVQWDEYDSSEPVDHLASVL